MTTIPPDLQVGDDDPSRSNTPLASQSSSQLNYSEPADVPTVATPSDAGPDPSIPPDDLLSPNLLPIRHLLTNKLQSSYTLSDVITDTSGFEALSPELASTEISIAIDGSFVETPSGPAARELKKRWDHNIGVGKSVRSPYAITAFVNQHGKQMFRVGRRELSAPAANAAEIEERITHSTTPSESSNSPRAKRRSRMSMHAFPSMFKNGSVSSGSRQHVSISQASGPRKLRKTRSIPDMISQANDPSSSQNTTGTTTTGRAHSRSVTGADISPFSTVIRSNQGDLFGEVMNWLPSSPPTTSSSMHSLLSAGQAPNEPYDHVKFPSTIAYPFGHGVTFNSPSRKMTNDTLPPPAPRLLREMQSFESGLTARQVDSPKHPGRDSSPSSYSPLVEPNEGRPLSALRIHSPPTSIPAMDVTPTSPIPESKSSPQPETFSSESPPSESTLISPYSTDVFDVLQTYRGLPLLDKLSLESEETTVKMSLSADETAAPRDDPRFVIWGEIQVDRDHDDQSVSHDSVTDLSVQSSSMSKRRASKAKVLETSSARLSIEETQRVLIAATIERWIAQLTSDLNYDELLDFFLTYRTYVSAVDLCHLLICRFHWALQPAKSSHDERVRRIVRVRTFVAIRYWLLTFFTVDFLPNRELRLLVANWLNTLIRDPILKKHSDGLGIVRKLIKVVKECKQAHTRTTTKSKPRLSSTPLQQPAKQEHVLGEKFAAATRKPALEDEDSDVDLDFLPDEGAPADAVQGFPHDPANAHLTTAHVGAGLSPTRPASIPFSSFSILHRTDHAPGPGTETEVPFIQTPAMLPVHHNALSRAFVKTIGHLGRWKRVLNSRAAARTSLAACADVSAFDLELSVSKDLLSTSGGVEQYLKMVGPPSPIPAPAPVPAAIEALHNTEITVPSPAFEDLPTHPPHEAVLPPLVPDAGIEPPPDYDVPPPEEPAVPVLASLEPEAAAETITPTGDVDQDDRAVSLRSSSTDSFGAPLTAGGIRPTFPYSARSQRQFDVVSIDDLDLSDTSSDHHEVGPAVPPGLRRPPRRLPLRRDFEFLRRSDTISSMGLTSRDSMTSNTSSAISSSSATGFGANVAQWQLNALFDSLSNDEESGGVEDALRRLEGQINPQKQQEKASKVDGWVRTIQERMAAGDYTDERPLFSDDDGDEDEDESEEDHEFQYGSASDSIDDMDSASQHQPTISTPSISGPEDHGEVASGDGTLEMVNTPVPTQTAHVIPAPPGPASPTRASDAKPAPEDAVPLEILQSRMPSRPSTASSQRRSLSRFAPQPEPARVHRSFILNYRAATLAEHFAMIDRELFMGVKFEELVLEDWMSVREVNVLDWAQYLKDRARWKAESRYPDKTSALASVRARFNLVANFTISEIVLTPPNERPVLVAKFIRIAWKSYGMYNFGTLVAIIAGLKSDWVTKAMRRPGWSRVGIWENRMFKDLKVYTSSANDFKHIRQTVASIVDVKPLETSTHATSVVSGGGTDAQSGKGKAPAERPNLPSACIPFIGVYLSQLQRHSLLPDLIDPTAPDEAVGINPITGNFDAPAHPEVFDALAPLPSSMHLEPLINVHKQRRIAGVIKSLVAGQHLASRVQFELDKKLFQKCLRLRGLNSETLQLALAMYPE